MQTVSMRENGRNSYIASIHASKARFAYPSVWVPVNGEEGIGQQRK